MSSRSMQPAATQAAELVQRRRVLPAPPALPAGEHGQVDPLVFKRQEKPRDFFPGPAVFVRAVHFGHPGNQRLQHQVFRRCLFMRTHGILPGAERLGLHHAVQNPRKRRLPRKAAHAHHLVFNSGHWFILSSIEMVSAAAVGKIPPAPFSKGGWGGVTL